MKETPKTGKLATYAVIMLLMAIIVIIIAAMADDREQHFQSQIESTTKTNMDIQQEIVALKDENYKIKQENESLKAELEQGSVYSTTCAALSEALRLYDSGDTKAAEAKLEKIDASALTETLIPIYNSVSTLITNK